VSNTRKKNIVITEDITNDHQTSPMTLNTQSWPEYGKYISEESLYACLNELIKERNFEGHVVFMDTMQEFTEELSISTNMWNGTVYLA